LIVSRAVLFRRVGLAIALAVPMCVTTTPPVLVAQIASADEVKAAFVFNFAKFVEWPPDVAPPGAPLVIGVLGNDAVEESLRTVTRGKVIDGRQLTVRRLTSGDDFTRVHLLFVGAAERMRMSDVLRRVDGFGVLTVSDAERFCQAGGVIALAMEENRVRFDVNLDAAEHGRLKVSSKLLSLARTVKSAKASGDR
jgi:hypothetical protein